MDNIIFKRELNLIPRELLLKKEARRKRTHITILLMVFFFCFFSLYFYPERMINSYQRRLEEKKETFLSVERDKKLLYSLRERSRDYTGQKEAISIIEERTASPLFILSEIGSILPPGVKVESFHLLGKQRLDIAFQVQNPLQVADLSVLLSESGNYEVEDLTTIPLEEGEETVRFILFFIDTNSR